MRYVDTEKLKAEINERLMAVNLEKLGNFGSHRVWAYNDVKDIIDSLQQEQPEADLEKEIEEHVEGMPMSEFTHESEVDIHYDWARKEFRYFFELGLDLGLNARKV